MSPVSQTRATETGRTASNFEAIQQRELTNKDPNSLSSIPDVNASEVASNRDFANEIESIQEVGGQSRPGQTF